MPNPDGWDKDREQFNLPFVIELEEDFHIHWQDMRIEMDGEDFDEFVIALKKAHDRWVVDGKPKTLLKKKKYGWLDGERPEKSYKNQKYNAYGKLSHHFRTFPRSENGKLIYDNAFQIEEQDGGQYHIHYKNFRFELGKNTIKDIAKIFEKLLKSQHLQLTKWVYPPTLSDFFKNHFIDNEFYRMDVIVKYLFIEHYFGENDFGRKFYLKVGIGRGPWDEEKAKRFDILIESFKANGFKRESPIPLHNGFLSDGAHRFACALYFNVPIVYIIPPTASAAVSSLPKSKRLNRQWLSQLDLTNSEIDMLYDKLNDIKEKVIEQKKKK